MAMRYKTIDDPYSNATPGPGSYNISGNIGRNDKKGLIKERSRPQSAAYSKVPGPGAYNPRRMRKGKNQKIGTQEKLSMGRYKTGTPGPGAYEPGKRRKGGKVRIGSAVRRPLYDSKNTPGPGNYNVRGKIGGPKYGIKPRRGDIGHGNCSKVPGPARYNPSL